jgi:hypothetical protein
MSNGTPAAAPESGGSNRLLIVLWVVAVVAVGVGAYFVGKAAADAGGAEKKGERQGRAAEAATYAPGTSKYQAIYRKGENSGRATGERLGRREGERQGAERGRKVGFERGEKVGTLKGERAGVVSGANAALGGLTGWDVGSWYIVKMATGANGVPYAVAQRKEMSVNDRYAICADNPADVCTERVPG